MKILWTMVAALLCATSAWANDSAVEGTGGRWRRLSKEHAQVRMVSETIDITIRNFESYTTEANFVFRNDGPAQTVRMGFPESAAGDAQLEAGKSTFLKFETSVDGRPFRATRVLSKQDEIEKEALWIKSVPFARNQTRRVRVRYQSPYGFTSGVPFHRWVSYDFTGGNWKGRVASTRLTIHVERPGTYLAGTRKDESEDSFVQPQFARRGRDFIYSWQNWQAEQGFVFFIDETLRGWLNNATTYDPKTQRVADHLLPVNIDIPGRKTSEAKVDYLPSGVWRNEKLFVSLREWLDAATEKKRPFKQRWDAKTNTAIIERDGKTARFRAGEAGAFAAKRNDQSTLFVPADVLGKTFGAGFRIDAKAHRVEFLN